ncbi:MAG TPA: ATP-grasp domain-containing protein [Vicinamibacterales bacterium]|nr:ATP-grasp domain-containing protein [Vicinamibacterales bacterium]
MKRVLFLATTTGYQTRMFGEAAQRLGITLVFATDRCDQLDDPWWDGAIPVRFHQEATAVNAIVAAAQVAPFDGVLAVGDRPTVVGAHAARLLDLPGHPPEGAHAARDKRLTRTALRGAGLPTPIYEVVSSNTEPHLLTSRLSFPVVVKPLVLSGSRGVIRANTAAEFVAAFQQLQRLLQSPDVLMMQDAAASEILIEQFIEGREYALEGVLDDGTLHTFAIFDKPDPLDGPYFEETIYVTPSRATMRDQQAIKHAVGAAAKAIGLFHGPVHAECRVNPRGVFVLEVAARPIGGLCAQALRFVNQDGTSIGLEELLLRHAIGEPVSGWSREEQAAGVMMIPIPAAGVYRRVDGVDAATGVPGISAVHITAKRDQQLVPLPEGASYLGFIFARADTPDAVERALREAHAALRFTIDRAIAVG